MDMDDMDVDVHMDMDMHMDMVLTRLAAVPTRRVESETAHGAVEMRMRTRTRTTGGASWKPNLQLRALSAARREAALARLVGVMVWTRRAATPLAEAKASARRGASTMTRM